MQEDTDLFTSKVLPNLLLVCISGNLDRKVIKEVATALGDATVPTVEKQLRKEDAVASATEECKGSGRCLLDSHRKLGFALTEPEGGQETLPPSALPQGGTLPLGKRAQLAQSVQHISAEAN